MSNFPRDTYRVIGNPVAHSKSPQIHALFATQTQQDLEYGRQLVFPYQFANAVMEFREQGGKGCNITVPFKQDAWAIATEYSPYAKRAKAVNTLMFKPDGNIYGANTDGLGLVRDLAVNKRIVLQGKRILLLGAGGAVRGVLQPLLEQEPSEIFIANRTPSRATELVNDFKDLGKVDGGAYYSILERYDVIINGTAASLADDLPPIPSTCLKPDTICYDMMYSAKPTIFMQWASDRGLTQVYDGLGMLVEQAADAFAIWRGMRPLTKPVLQQLRAEMDASLTSG